MNRTEEGGGEDARAEEGEQGEEAPPALGCSSWFSREAAREAAVKCVAKGRGRRR